MIKATALFQLGTNVSGGSQGGPRLGGWSESWYYDLAPDFARLAFLSFCGARAKLLPLGSAIVGQRYQLLGGGSSTGSIRMPGTSNIPADVPQMAFLMKAVGAGVVNIRRFTFRGIPDAAVVEGEVKNIGGLLPSIAGIGTALTGGLARFRGRDISAATAGVFGVDAAGVVTLYKPLAFAVGDFIQFRRMYNQYRQLVAGRYQVSQKTSDTVFTVRGWRAGDTVTQNGTASVYSQVFPLVERIELARVVVRKVGRPFEQYRGRSSKRRR